MRSKLVLLSVFPLFTAFVGAACSSNEPPASGHQTHPLETADEQLLAIAGERLGQTLSISGDLAVVGAPFSNAGGVLHPGAAFVFERVDGTWVQRQKLFASDPIQDGFYGLSVAVDGDVIAVGATRAQDGEGNAYGAAYVYGREGDTWVEQAKLFTSDGGLLKSFGYSIDIEGDTIVVGSRWAEVAGKTDAGAAYVFVRGEGTSWVPQGKLTADDANNYDTFGFSVSISGDTIAVGSYLSDVLTRADAGAVYVYKRTDVTWSQEAKLTASDANASDVLGYSVSIDGDIVIAGAPGRDREAGADVGVARVFTRSGTVWTEGTPLALAAGAAGDRFGEGVALRGTTALIGAPRADADGLTDAGASYLFVASDGAWVEDNVIEATTGAAQRAFGTAVALGEREALIGAPGPGVGDGYAYVFRVLLEQGDTCATSEDCLTGHCIDGVCCADACGDGATNDCMACSVAAGAAQDGVCGPAAGIVCRASTGACDVAEACTAETTTCPDDAPLIDGCCTTDDMCNDANVCTADSCNLTTNTCDAPPIEGCCNTDDMCNDDNVCTDDTCNTDTNTCAASAIEGCCLSATDCNDDNACTTDSCNTDTNTCMTTAIEGCCLEASDCDDGDECTDDACVDMACAYTTAAACVDAGTPDAGTPDAGTPDGGAPDAGTPDGGVTPPSDNDDGGCSVTNIGTSRAASASNAFAFALMLAAFLFRRRGRASRKR